MRYLVTGAAGLIGSHISERLLREGHDVLGIDCFLESYPRNVKEDRLKWISDYKNFEFIEESLLNVDLLRLLDGIDIVFHQAALAGVRASWGENFKTYLDNNVLATQKLLEAAREVRPKKIIYASSSSVYGEVDEDQLPITEETHTKPVSPYGVTKLAGEHLCYLYWKNFGVPTVSLRYFTVFGPKPRPDMAFCIFSRAILAGEQLQMFGDGEQSRGFTHISDVVDANLSASEKDCDGEVFNIGGGTRVSMNEVVKILEEITGKKANVHYKDPAKGDTRHTFADTRKARQYLGYVPKTDFKEGLAQLVESVKDFYNL